MPPAKRSIPRGNRQTFSIVLSIVGLYRKYARVLTFQNDRQYFVKLVEDRYSMLTHGLEEEDSSMEDLGKPEGEPPLLYVCALL